MTAAQTDERAAKVAADQEAMDRARVAERERRREPGGGHAAIDADAIREARRVFAEHGIESVIDELGGPGRPGDQLSFELGVGRSGAPDFATAKVAGSLGVRRNLLYMEPVTVTLTDRFGGVIAEASATVGYPGFKDHFDKQGGKTIERVHTLTLE